MHAHVTESIERNSQQKNRLKTNTPTTQIWQENIVMYKTIELTENIIANTYTLLFSSESHAHASEKRVHTDVVSSSMKARHDAAIYMHILWQYKIDHVVNLRVVDGHAQPHAHGKDDDVVEILGTLGDAKRDVDAVVCPATLVVFLWVSEPP